MQPFSADPPGQSGYLTPVTPLDRRLHSASASYHPSRAPELLASPVTTGHRSNVYSPESTSPTVSLTRSLSGHQEQNMSAMNGHGVTRYQPQHIRPYGQSSNSYLPEATRAILKADNDQRAAYMEMSYMEHQGLDHLNVLVSLTLTSCRQRPCGSRPNDAAYNLRSPTFFLAPRNAP